MLFGRQLREFLPVPLSKLRPCDSWRLLREDREKALAKRALRSTEKLSLGSRMLSELLVGDTVRIQNLVGNYPTRWDNTGVIVEKHDFDKYVVSIHGSGRLVTRNRRYLRKIIPYGEHKEMTIKSMSDSLLYEQRKIVDDQAETSTGLDGGDGVPLQAPAPAKPLELSDMPGLVLDPSSVTSQRMDPGNVAGPHSEPEGSLNLRRSERISVKPKRLLVDPKAKSYASSVSQQLFLST